MSLYPALAGALFVRFAPVGWRRALFFAAAWTLTEWLRGWFLTVITSYSIHYTKLYEAEALIKDQPAGFA